MVELVDVAVVSVLLWGWPVCVSSMSLGSASGAMSLREPITPESLCIALNRATSLRLVLRDVVLTYHHWRWLAHLPAQRIAFVADTENARQRLADRAHFRVPRIEWVEPLLCPHRPGVPRVACG
jgi:hypothetical protein